MICGNWEQYITFAFYKDDGLLWQNVEGDLAQGVWKWRHEEQNKDRNEYHLGTRTRAEDSYALHIQLDD